MLTWPALCTTTAGVCSLRAVFNAHEEPLRRIARKTKVDVAALSRIASGTRPSVSLRTVETLAEYLGLELTVRARRRPTRS
jgi:transcriptional regulator with XRE-family HTH domain